MGWNNKNKLAAMAMFPAMVITMAGARADVSYEVSAGVSTSDNITRVAVNEVDETLAEVGLLLGWEEHSRRIDGLASVDLSYVEYLENTYDSEVLGTATGDVTFGIVPERFTWEVQDTFGQSQTDPFSPVTPETLENINYFSTGPDLILNFGQVMSAQLFGRYSNTDYEDSPLDAERMAYGVALGRQMSERSRVALNLVADESTFDEPLATDYQRRNAYLSYDLTEGGRSTIAARVGYNWLEMDGQDETGGALFQLNLTRQVTASSTLTLSVDHSFSDAGEMLNDTGGSTEITSSSDPFENSDASLEWRFDRHRTSIGVSAGFTERRYETQTAIDSDRWDFTVDLGRMIRPTLRLSLAGTFTTEEFVNTGQESDDLMLNLGLDWRFGRRLGLRVGYELYERNSEGMYEENRFVLMFTFHGDRERPAIQ